jgi:hypothetical protein
VLKKEDGKPLSVSSSQADNSFATVPPKKTDRSVKDAPDTRKKEIFHLSGGNWASIFWMV